MKLPFACEETDAVRTAGQRYMFEFAACFLAYVVVLVALILAYPEPEQAGPYRYALFLLPIVPGLGMALAVVRMLRRSDEMVSAVQMKSMAVGFGVAVLLAPVLGFLSIAGLDLNPWGPWAIFSAAMASWGISVGRCLATQSA